MLNVLHLINYPGKGGTEKYILSLAERLNNKSCKVHLGYSEEGPMLEEIKALGVETYNIKMRNSFDFKAAKALKSLCKEYSIDIVHTHFLRENCIAVLSKILGNKIVVVRTHHLLADGNIPVRIFNSFLTAFTDKTITVCNAVKNQMAPECINSDKINVIYNGIDLDYWKGEHNCKIREEFGIDNKTFLVTSVARFSEEKGHIFYLEAIKQFYKVLNREDKPGAPKVKFLLVGDGDFLEPCMKFVDMMGITNDIIFTGFRKDVKDILDSSDLFISHSSSEALSISILEAMASNLPVISTDVGGSAEIIGKNEGGIIVQYGEVEEMANAILKMITDKEFYESSRISAKKIVSEKFNLDTMVEQVYNIYMQSLSSGNA